MGLVSISLPSDGTTADVADINTPLTTLKDEINGNLDNANIKSGAAIDGPKLADGTVSSSKLGDSGWLTPTMTTGFSVSTSLAYRKIGDVVYIRGQVSKDSGNIASSENLFTLPEGYRPAVLRIYSCPGVTTSTMKIVVNTNGVVATASTPTSSTSYVGLDTINFPTN